MDLRVRERHVVNWGAAVSGYEQAPFAEHASVRETSPCSRAGNSVATTVGEHKRPPRRRAPVDTTRAASAPRWRSYVKALGPGLVTGASDDDPSGIATYSQAGASFGIGLLWTTLLTFPLMATVQEICDRTALATGKGLGELATVRLGSRGRHVVMALVGLLIVANALNIAADLVAIGSGMSLLHAGPTVVWAVIAGAAITGLLVSGSFELVARIFKLLCLTLLSYVAVLFVIHVHWAPVVHATFLPHFSLSSSYIGLLVAVLGTTISPYLFFWQSLHRLEEMRDEPAGGTQPQPLRGRSSRSARLKERTSRLDVFTGMAFSNVVMFAIMVTTAATLGSHGKNKIQSAAEAASALRPIAGQLAYLLFALGFIGAGMLAIPVLAGAGSAGMAGLLGKTAGFSRSPRRAPVFYGLVLVGTLGGTALSLFGVNPIRLLILVAVINGVAAAPFLVLVMLISDDRKIMGKYTNGKLARTLGWTTTVLMAAAAVTLFAFANGGGLY
jgi:NRAMP (natural resistance-associated macrophage protein)-like metal ion transporter